MGLLDWLTSAERTQQMQGLGNNLKGAIDNLKQSRGLLNAAVMEDIASMKSGNGFAANTPTQMRLDQMISNGVVNSIGPLMTKGVGKFVYPQEQALLTAQKNAALPIEKGGLGLPANNTPMDRARAMGATDVFHGTVDDIKQLNPSMYGTSTGSKSAKQAFWTVDNPDVAATYAHYAATYAPVQNVMKQADLAEKVAQRTGNWDKYEALLNKAETLESEISANMQRGQNVMPLVALKRGPTMDAAGESFHGVEGDINKFLLNSRRQGAATITNLDDAAGRVDMPANHTAIFDPSLLRSRFAAFDPLRRHEADLLAGAIPFSVMVDQRENLGLGR